MSGRFPAGRIRRAIQPKKDPPTRSGEIISALRPRCPKHVAWVKSAATHGPPRAVQQQLEVLADAHHLPRTEVARSPVMGSRRSIYKNGGLGGPLALPGLCRSNVPTASRSTIGRAPNGRPASSLGRSAP